MAVRLRSAPIAFLLSVGMVVGVGALLDLIATVAGAYGQLGDAWELFPRGFWLQATALFLESIVLATAAAWWRRPITWLAGWAGFALGGSLLTLLHALHVDEVCRTEPFEECFFFCSPCTVRPIADLLAQVPRAFAIFAVLGAPVYLFVGLLVYFKGRLFSAAAPGP